jgi:hypothetical protein
MSPAQRRVNMRTLPNRPEPVNDENIIEFPDPKLQEMLREIEASVQAVNEAIFARRYDRLLVLITRQHALTEKLIRYGLPPGPDQDHVLALLHGEEDSQ